jgi:hypothetical protein
MDRAQTIQVAATLRLPAPRNSLRWMGQYEARFRTAGAVRARDHHAPVRSAYFSRAWPCWRPSSPGG